jgi:hypothetical protein
MKKSLLVASALAVVVGSSGVLAQQERGAPAEKSAPKSSGNAPGAPSPGAMHNGAEKSESGKSTQRPEPNRSQAQENRGRSETTGQTPNSQPREQSRDNDRRNQTTGQAPSERREQTRENDRSREGGRTPGQQNQKSDRVQERTNRDRNNADRQEDRRETTGQGAASGRSSAVNISTENRIKIHNVIIEERSAPRVDHVDFNISVGTVVPKTVKLVTVPSTIVSIEPSWRGFEYFLVGDQIIIVNPRTMEIVAVLDA